MQGRVRYKNGVYRYALNAFSLPQTICGPSFEKEVFLCVTLRKRAKRPFGKDYYFPKRLQVKIKVIKLRILP